MDKLQVKTDAKNYDVILGESLENLSHYIKEESKCLIITDENAKQYLSKVKGGLKKAGHAVQSIVFPSGEGTKSKEALFDLYSKMATCDYGKDTLLIALGGGVIGDLTGFVASTYMRGVKYIQLPTTLLAMIDSCVGGKTAINLPNGKNLIGTFYQPELVLIDHCTLKTLPPLELKSALGEAIKYSLIADLGIVDDVMCKNYQQLIYKCLSVKAQLVHEDTQDVGARRTLNLGHTIGHAIEASCKFKKTHGECVALGLICMARLGEHLGLSEKGITKYLKQTYSKIGLSSKIGSLNIDKLSKYIKLDKKSNGDFISVIIPVKIGEVKMVEFEHEQFIALLKEVING